ncbi:4-(cytidine 5'-diphospho)-2-C-methyl-D-erythritol kinase [Nocardioides marmoraquaticus]
MSLTVRAPAKVNLRLDVGPPRADGFHPLSTVYQAVGLYDDVTATEAESWSVTVEAAGEVDVREVPLDAGNLAVRAGQALVAHHGLDRAARLHVHKGIPVAGGLAGGSADAAATLVAVDRLWDLGTPDDDLLAVAAGLGSDVPFALVGGTAWGTGRGELVEPVADAGAWWWVVLPDVQGLSTPQVYAAHDDLGLGRELDRPDALLAALSTGDPDALAAALGNDLQAPALHLRPALTATRDAVLGAGAVAALLSGSGPTWLGLCRDAAHARAVAEPLRAEGRTVLLAPGPVAGSHPVVHA